MNSKMFVDLKKIYVNPESVHEFQKCSRIRQNVCKFEKCSCTHKMFMNSENVENLKKIDNL